MLTKQFIKYISNSVLAMVGISFYVLADTYFISVYGGADGLAVLNLVIPFFCLLLSVGLMIGVGFATRFRIERAEGKDGSHLFFEALLWDGIFSIPFLVLALFFSKQILLLLGASGVFVNEGAGYFKFLLLGTPFFMANDCLIAFSRNDGNPKLAMIGTITGSVLNVALDYVFIFIFDWGLPGAAIATSLSPVAGLLICSLHFKSSKCTIQLNKDFVKSFNPKNFVKNAPLGATAMMGELATSVTTAVYNALILRIAGNDALAAFGIICNIGCVVVAVFNGIGEGSQPMISQKYGENNFKDMYRLLRIGVMIMTCAAALCVFLCTILATPVVNIFNSSGNNAMFVFAKNGLILYSLGYLFEGLNTEFLTFFAARDLGKAAIIGSLLRGVVLIIFFAFALSSLWGMTGIWLSFSFAEFATFIFVGIYFICGMKKERL